MLRLFSIFSLCALCACEIIGQGQYHNYSDNVAGVSSSETNVVSTPVTANDDDSTVAPPINVTHTAPHSVAGTAILDSGVKPHQTDPLATLPTLTVENPVRVCSPLVEHPLASLNQIVSDPFHPPPLGKDDRHQGVDFAYYNDNIRSAIAGEGITAIMSGIVVAVQDDRLPYGNMVIIETPYAILPPEVQKLYGVGENMSIYHLYAHMSTQAVVSIGDDVQCGQLLGYVGKTGYNIVNPHLHLELRVGSTGFEFGTMAYYDPYASDDERSMYETWRISGDFIPVDPMALLELTTDATN